MKWAVPDYSRMEVNRAGRCLLAGGAGMGHDEMLKIINNWRSSHGFPLQSMKMTLKTRAKKIDKRSLIAQRLKRLPSIEAKLNKHSSWMKLTGIQDIGGCRAIVATVRDVERLVQLYKQGMLKNPTTRHTLCKENDYITNPKDDGYRSYHLVYRYKSDARKHSVYNDLKIEIQIRSRLQHAWATAVEIVDAFTGQALKASSGSADWKRFFCLMAGAVAMRERRPAVPGTPIFKTELIEELRRLTQELDVITVLEAWRMSLTVFPERTTAKVAAFLLTLDPKQRVVRFDAYTQAQLPEATEQYLEIEKSIAANPVPGKQTVLVSVNSLQALRSAYPNYYLDATHFIKALQYALRT